MATDLTPLYDRPSFFDAYMLFPRQQQGLAGAPEWPIMRAMVGSVADKRVLDLGCGLGWFARWAVENNARYVDAYDISEKMISGATKMTEDLDDIEAQERIRFEIKDLKYVELDRDGYEVMFSSLTLHYLDNSAFKRLLRCIYDSLVPGGIFVFSTEHPIFTAPVYAQFLPLSAESSDGDRVWPLTRYADEGIRETDWMGGVIKYHRTIEGILGGLLGAGFRITAVKEFASREDLEVEGRDHWRRDGEGSRPMFLIIKVQRES